MEDSPNSESDYTDSECEHGADINDPKDDLDSDLDSEAPSEASAKSGPPTVLIRI
jgi:hypothetical protein